MIVCHAGKFHDILNRHPFIIFHSDLYARKDAYVLVIQLFKYSDDVVYHSGFYMTGWFRIFVVDRMIKPEIGDIKTKKSQL
jgi:hypothetical protein